MAERTKRKHVYEDNPPNAFEIPIRTECQMLISVGTMILVNAYTQITI